MRTQKDVIKQVAEVTGGSQAACGKIVKAALDIVFQAVVAGEDVQLTPLGRFKQKAVKERNAVNPSTGEKMVIPAKQGVSFRVSDKLKKARNGAPK